MRRVGGVTYNAESFVGEAGGVNVLEGGGRDTECVCVYICLSRPLPTVHSIGFTLGGGIAEDQREISDEREFGWMSGSGDGTRSERALHELSFDAVTVLYVFLRLNETCPS